MQPWSILFWMLSTFICLPASAQTYSMQKGVIYLVRHAEKDTGSNPPLTRAGYTRSGDLARVIQGYGIQLDHIYISQYQRSRLTADSLRLSMQVDTVHYLADNSGDGLLLKLAQYRAKDKKIVVVAHSNTIPIILKRLGVNHYPASIPDEEYDRLYIISYRKNKARLRIEKFGL